MRPYKLLGCLHEACRQCLASYLENNLFGPNEVPCPIESCSSLVRVRDIESVIGESKFERACDYKVVEFARGSPSCSLCERCHYISW